MKCFYQFNGFKTAAFSGILLLMFIFSSCESSQRQRLAAGTDQFPLLEMDIENLQQAMLKAHTR